VKWVLLGISSGGGVEDAEGCMNPHVDLEPGELSSGTKSRDLEQVLIEI
jgi:hypothetical protein